MKKTVLVAEDDRVLAEIIRFNLEMFGFDVVNAFDGETACNLLEQREFNAVVTDYQMPKRDGAAVCQAVRNSTKNQEVPLFVCTAKGYELDTGELKKQFQVTGFFLKPFSPRELVTKVNNAVESEETIES